MKAYQLTEFNLQSLVMVDLPEPMPAKGQVRIAMKAACVNFRDLAVATGKYARAGKPPLVPLSDGVGIIDAVGEGVTGFQVGDRVTPIFAPRWLSGPPTDCTTPALGGEFDGVLQEKIVADATAVVRVPDHLADVEAATLTVAGVTAWSALVHFGKVKPGDTVLIEGTGGVSLFALQFAKLAGARVAIVSSSNEKLDRARTLGADICVNYREIPEWGAEIARLTGGANIVIETVGAQTIAQALAATARGARIAQIGLLSGVGASLPLQIFIPRNIDMRGILVGGRDRHEEMNAAINWHKLRPVISQTFGFDQAAAALAQLPKGEHFGKIAIAFT